MSTYLGYDIFEPQVKKPHETTIANNYEVLGELHNARETYNKAETNLNFQVIVYQDTHEDRIALKEFFIGKKGKLLPFWYVDPIPIGRVLESTATATLKIKDTSLLYRTLYTRLVLYDKNTGFITYVTNNEKAYSEELGKYEILTVAHTPTESIAQDTLLYALIFVRFDSDTLKFEAESYQTSTSALVFKELQAEVKEMLAI